MTDSLQHRVALFGGSFNPPHVCHTLATLWVLQTQRVDRVWWIPTYQHAFDKALTPFEDRVAMCELAIEKLHSVEINRVEHELGGESRTIDTVTYLQKKHPELRFSLVVGADILEEAPRWKNWEGLMELVDLIVVGRKGYVQETGPQIIDLDLPDISSTMIRRVLAEGRYESILDWIPHRVLDFISSHHLYRDQEGQ